MSRILVTGGLGLVGHHVVNLLQTQDHEVSIVDNKTDYNVIPSDELDYLISERSKKITLEKYYNIDIVNRDALDIVFNLVCPDLVIHMASFPRQKVVNSNPILAARTMAEGLVNLCELSKKYNVKRLVYISSSMVYGEFTDDITENYVCNPQGLYGILKLAGENIVKDYTRRNVFDHIIIRPSAVYGPLDVQDRAIAKFMLSAMRGGVLHVNGKRESLDFTYVEDAARGIVDASLSKNTANKTYNITKSHSRTLFDAANLAVKIAGAGTINIREKDSDFPSRGSLNIDLARKDFSFDPKVDVEEGFERYYHWLSNSNYWKAKLL